MSRKQTNSLKINYYISGHGFGHATRSAQIVQALLCANDKTQITVITTAPQHLFTPSDRLKFISRAVDSAIVQPQPYTIDAVVSFRNLQTFLQATDNDQWHAEASSLLELSDCNMIVADAPCPIIWNCNRSIKSVLISNFSFDAIFEELIQYLPPADQAINQALVTKLRKLYASYSHVIRLPGFIDLPFVNHHWTVQQKQDNVFDSPLVFRQARKSRREVLSMLGVANEDHDRKKILLVQFGGQIVGGSSERRPQLPKDWICLNASVVPGDSNFVTFPPDVYSPDLIETADVILGKIGMKLPSSEHTSQWSFC